MRRAPDRDAQADARRHLLRRLLEQMERTFALEGQPGALRVASDLLGLLDDEALRSYAYQQGIRTEDEWEPEAGSQGEAIPST